MKTITESNSTKKEILTAYNEALAQAKLREAGMSDPSKEVFAKKTGEVLDKANTVTFSIEDQIAGLKKHVSTILGDLSTNIAEEITTYENVKNAIALKESELKELFAIEKEAFTLTALVNSNSSVRDEFRTTLAEEKAKGNLELDELRKQLVAIRDVHYLDTENYDDEIEKGRERAQEQYSYDFKRTKKLDNDAWTDDKNAREKVLADAEVVIKNKLTDIVAREEKIDVLEAKVAEIPLLIASATKDGETAGEKHAAVGFGFEKRSIESKANSEKSILENKIEMLTERVERQQTENDQLKSDLKDAYAKIQETAKASVEAGANIRTIASYESMAKNNGNQK